MGLPETIITQTGKALNRPKLPDKKNVSIIKNDKQKQKYRDRLARTKKYYKGLTNEEIASKINSARGSNWVDTQVNQVRGKESNQFLEHFKKHKDEFKKYGKNVVVNSKQDYINVSRRVLNEFDKVFPHAHSDGKSPAGADRTGFYNSKMNVLTVVDMNEHRITSSFPMKIDIDDYFKYAMELE